MARSPDEVEKMIAAAAANPIGARLLELIFARNNAVELHRIYTHDIPETEGISESERDALREAVNPRFAALNAAATWPPDKPRWAFIKKARREKCRSNRVQPLRAAWWRIVSR